MKTLFTILLVILCAATGYGQTMKALMYNTNGRIVYSGTNELMFTNAVGFAEGDLKITASGGIAWAGELKYEAETQTFFSALEFSSTNVSAATRTNLSLGATWLTNTNVTNFLAAIGLSATNDVVFNSVNVTNAAATRTNLGLPLQALTNSSVTNFRAAIGLSLPALTNTSNVMIMRALAGSTNTNQPYSGTFDFQDFSDNTVRLTISNGIILNIEFP
jgi:phage-related holin